jgi:hypothetical protein
MLAMSHLVDIVDMVIFLPTHTKANQLCILAGHFHSGRSGFLGKLVKDIAKGFKNLNLVGVQKCLLPAP